MPLKDLIQNQLTVADTGAINNALNNIETGVPSGFSPQALRSETVFRESPMPQTPGPG